MKKLLVLGIMLFTATHVFAESLIGLWKYENKKQSLYLYLKDDGTAREVFIIKEPENEVTDSRGSWQLLKRNNAYYLAITLKEKSEKATEEFFLHQIEMKDNNLILYPIITHNPAGKSAKTKMVSMTELDGVRLERNK